MHLISSCLIIINLLAACLLLYHSGLVFVTCSIPDWTSLHAWCEATHLSANNYVQLEWLLATSSSPDCACKLELSKSFSY